jgi:hypothetical protein
MDKSVREAGMSRANSVTVFGLLLGLLVVLGGTALLKGGLYVGKHEGDTLHLIEIVFRMAQGEIPHLDFMTPIGALAFAPIVVFVKAGFGIGMAVLWAQVLVAAAMLPCIWWVAQSRLSGATGALFSLFVMVLLLALVHGEAQRSVSMSMHYNRWAWAAAFVAILAAILPPVRNQSGTVDGVIIGLMMTALMLIKVTYFAAFSIPVILALVLTGQRRALVVALLTGLTAVAGVTLVVGVPYWGAYLGDLLTVAGSTVRSLPGEPLGAIMGAPAYLGGSIAAVAGVILLRQSKQAAGGLVLLLLLPGFFYVTFQNFGNDPQWLLLVGVLLLALRPAADVVNANGWNMRSAVTINAAVVLALAAPSFFNLAYSPFRHFRVNVADYAPMLPRGGINADLQTADIRALRVDVRVPLDGPGSGLESYRDRAKRDPEAVFKGETFPICTTELGLPALFDTITRDLEQAGFAGGKRVFAADLFSSYWLYGDLSPLVHGAPWYYGGLPGFDSADYLLIPLCPVAQDLQAGILKDIEARGADDLTEVRRTPLYVLYAKG